ncbi:hypothetical protein, partial [Raoultella planticola]|uniref:hypothetical protein n=2 Tax=Bacteria TaxID=2 RepID=UPI00177E5B50
IERHIKHNNFNSTTIHVLQYLTACATRYDGACTVLRQSVADKLNISISTVARCYMNLRAAEVISTHATRRKNTRGGSGANIIQILPFKTPDESPHKGDNNRINSSTATDNADAETNVTYINNLNINTLLDTHTTASWQQNFVLSRENTGLTEKTLDFLTLFAKSAKEAGNLVGMLYRCKKEVANKRNALLLLEDMDSAIYHTLRRVYATYKVSNIRNVTNYLYT